MGYPCYEPPCNCGNRTCSECGESVRELEMEEYDAGLNPELVFASKPDLSTPYEPFLDEVGA